MRHLLAQRFPTEFGLNPNTITLPLSVLSGSFTLSDSKACTACKAMPSRVDRVSCNEENLNVHSTSDVAVLDFEKYIAQFFKKNISINICDILLFDESINHHKIAFCDLTCSDEKWVLPNAGIYCPEGKRAKVKTQMMDSLEYLLKEPLLAVNILTFAEKICLFGWRDYDHPDVDALTPVHNNVGQNMQVFGRTPSSRAKQLTSENMILGHEFSFVQVKYPSVYEF